jgi:hypothetical protein
MPLIKLTTQAATALTGTLPDNVFPATLPVTSAVNLINIPAANISGTVALANLPTGSGAAQGMLQVGPNLAIVSGTVSLLGTGVNSALGYTAADDATVSSQGTRLTAAETAITGKQASLGYTAENAANKGAANGYASLDGAGKLPSSQIPALAITETYVVANEAAMLALAANVGDVAVRTDINDTFILQTAGASTLANWVMILTPSSPVTSVNTQVGNVVLTTTEIAEGTHLYYTAGRFDSAFTAKSTSDLTEGTNLYYTTGRFDTAFSAKSTTDLTEGTNLYYTPARFDTRLATATLDATHLAGAVPSASLTVVPAASLTGSIADARLSANVPLLNAGTNTFTGAMVATSFAGTHTGSGAALTGVVAAKVTNQSFMEMFAIGNLSAMVGFMADYRVNSGGAKTLGRIVLSTDTSGAAGTITVDVLKQNSVGGSMVTLFTTVAKPTMTSNGGLTWTIVTGAGLPDVVAIPDGCTISFQIVSAPADAENIKVELYEV